MSSKSQINTDAEEILIYLHKTERQTERTKQAIRVACQLADLAVTEAALRQLLHGGYVTNMTNGEYQLTLRGKQAARSLYNLRNAQGENTNDELEDDIAVSSGSKNLSMPLDYKDLFTAALSAHDTTITNSDVQDQTLHVLPNGIPSIYHHPLRLTAALTQTPLARRPSLILRYMLAFEVPKDSLPVPVLHNDILGRSRMADIFLRHDDYISSRHCRFEIRQENGVFTLYVEDLGSRNCTFIDNIPLEENKPYLLKHGSQLQVGNTVLIAVQIPY